MHERINKYTCDRCAKVEEISAEQSDIQPKGWARVTISSPVLASPMEVDPEGRIDQQLCESCVGDFKRHLRYFQQMNSTEGCFS